MKNLRTILAEEGLVRRAAYDEKQLERDLDKLVVKFFAELCYSHAELDDASEAIQIFIDSLSQLCDESREEPERGRRRRAKSKTAGRMPFKLGDVITPTVSGKQGDSRKIYHKGYPYKIVDLEDNYGAITVVLEDDRGQRDKVGMFPYSAWDKV